MKCTRSKPEETILVFLMGFTKYKKKVALFRGAGANGLRIAALCASMTGIYDLCKENSYYFFGLTGSTDSGLLQLLASLEQQFLFHSIW